MQRIFILIREWGLCGLCNCETASQLCVVTSNHFSIWVDCRWVVLKRSVSCLSHSELQACRCQWVLSGSKDSNLAWTSHTWLGVEVLIYIGGSCQASTFVTCHLWDILTFKDLCQSQNTLDSQASFDNHLRSSAVSSGELDYYLHYLPPLVGLEHCIGLVHLPIKPGGVRW